MTIYNDYRNMPGPGDEETWGPCVNHPGDPRTPDLDGEYEEKELELRDERMADVDGWFFESFSEAPNTKLKGLSEACIQGDSALVGTIVLDLVRTYCTPSTNDVYQAINDDRAEYKGYHRHDY